MKLIKISPSKVHIRSNDAEFSSVHLNDLISISDGDVELITMITELTDTDVEQELVEDDCYITNEMESMKNIECNIIGSVICEKFVDSIDRYPTTNVNARIIQSDELPAMMFPTVSQCFLLGKYSGYDACAWVDGNKFFQRHSCIVGNTGSGKSETVAKILEETRRGTNPNIIIFDIHGEYGNIADNTMNLGKSPFPIWIFGFNGMVTNLLKVKEDSTVVMSALRKAYRNQNPESDYSRPVYFNFDQLLEDMTYLDNEAIGTGEVYKTGDKKGMEKTSKGDFNGKLTGIINTMQTLKTNKLYDFLFHDNEQEFLEQTEQFLFESGIKNIDLSKVPHDVAVMIIGAIANIIYGHQINDTITPICLVCDEAHVYIPSGMSLTASQRRMVEIFENIAKEGRKFGVSLMVASQRPSELNKTIMAQCANYIVMKLNNENDKSMMKGIMAEGSSSIIESTTMFSPGDALVIGDAVPAPLKIHVELAKTRPQSRSIDFWDIWKEENNEIN